jgi:glucose-6-phosphate dehydrogenase assembly protein OpcA
MQTQESSVAVSAKGIDVEKIEKEMAAMWKSAAAGDEGSDADSGMTRACALNLIVYASVTEERAVVDEMLDFVSEQHPGRTLVLLADRASAEPRMEAYVSTRCRMLGGMGKQLCGEQITIEAAGSAIERAASAIEPLLVPDVPVFLWWKDIPHTEDKLFNRMTRMSDRVVIDSASFDRPHDDLRRLAQLIEEHPSALSLSDLNWGRLTAWRTLIASFWDVSAYRPSLEKLDRIIIEFDPPDAAPNEIAPKALLVLGWLASRLGWSIAGEGTGDEFHLRHDGGQLTVEMRPTTHAGHGDGMLVSLTFTAPGTGAEFYVALSEDRKKLVTEASIDGKRSVGRVLAYEEKTEGQRLSRELSLSGRDRIYEQAIALAAQLIEKI